MAHQIHSALRIRLLAMLHKDGRLTFGDDVGFRCDGPIDEPDDVAGVERIEVNACIGTKVVDVVPLDIFLIPLSLLFGRSDAVLT